jgi:hypothetical protein
MAKVPLGKKLLIVLIIPLLVGCFTAYRPVSTMYDWQLRNEYNDLQLKHTQLERELIYGEGRAYKTSELGITNTEYTGTDFLSSPLFK